MKLKDLLEAVSTYEREMDICPTRANLNPSDIADLHQDARDKNLTLLVGTPRPNHIMGIEMWVDDSVPVGDIRFDY